MAVALTMLLADALTIVADAADAMSCLLSLPTGRTLAPAAMSTTTTTSRRTCVLAAAWDIRRTPPCRPVR